MEQFDEHMLPFLENERFIKWVTNPDTDTNAYWMQWMKANPGKVQDLLNAKKLVTSLHDAQKPSQPQKLSEEIWQKIDAAISPSQPIVHFIPPARHTRYWMAASIVAICIISSVIYYFSTKNIQQNNKPLLADQFAVVLKDNTLKRLNKSSQNQVAYLVDGTKVTLQPGASIKHTVFLEKDKREVYLEGDAFFEVAKDAKRPFYVFTNGIVLKVLGTSFNVTTNKSNGNITVLVKTGKVSVYKSNNRDKAEFILTPNQRVLYTAVSQSITQSAIAGDQLALNVKPTAHTVNFNFEDMAVAKIFSALEDGYGIKINYDAAVFAKCTVTTSLTDEAFEEKLRIICAAISANYTIQNNQVFIDGLGCK